MDKILIEKEELQITHNQLINIRFPTINLFLFLMAVFKVFFNVSFPLPLFFLVFIMLASTFIYALAFDKIKNPSLDLIIKSYFVFMLFDLIILSMVIYFLGGVLWIGFVFYAFYAYINFLILPSRYVFYLILHSSFLYILVVISQYYNIYPYKLFFPAGEKALESFSFLATTTVAAIAFLWLVAYYGNVFYQLLRKKIEDLKKTKEQLEEARTTLEVRIKARTRELLEERQSLEEKVKERTKELEKERGELAKKIAELEKFHRVAVGRELKMRELKKEIEKMKEELKQNKKAEE